MRHEDSVTLEFVYRHVTQVSDSSHVVVVMADKDLGNIDNIDFINRYYKQAKLYQYNFACVIKYLKVKITTFN